jgi:predicted amidohydrolase
VSTVARNSGWIDSHSHVYDTHGWTEVPTGAIAPCSAGHDEALDTRPCGVGQVGFVVSYVCRAGRSPPPRYRTVGSRVTSPL